MTTPLHDFVTIGVSSTMECRKNETIIKGCIRKWMAAPNQRRMEA